VTLRLLSYNIRFGGRGREEALAAVIREARADVVVLQEAIDTRVVARLAELAEYSVWGSGKGQSTGFMSRLPVARHAWYASRAARHPFLEVVFEDDGRLPRIFGLHLTATFSKWSERRRAGELRALLEAIRHHQHGFHVIAGDFNALAPGELLQVARMPAWIRGLVWLSGSEIARDTIQLMLDEHYVDAWRRMHPYDPGYTFPTLDPHVRVDYLFAHERHADRLRACDVMHVPSSVFAASDHFPLLVELATGDG
jgi:exodeoxyribonuclease III